MLVYFIDEEDKFIKLRVIDGSPFGVTWTCKVYFKDKSGSWKFVSKTTFECTLRHGVSLTILNKNHKVSRFYIQKII